MKRCSTSLITREKQIKTTVEISPQYVRVAVIKKTRNSKYWRGYGEKGILVNGWWGCIHWCSHQGERYGIILEIEPLCCPEIPLLNIYLKKQNSPNTCFLLFILSDLLQKQLYCGACEIVRKLNMTQLSKSAKNCFRDGQNLDNTWPFPVMLKHHVILRRIRRLKNI